MPLNPIRMVFCRFRGGPDQFQVLTGADLGTNQPRFIEVCGGWGSLCLRSDRIGSDGSYRIGIKFQMMHVVGVLFH